MNYQCRKDGETVFAIVAPVYNMRDGFYLSRSFPFIHRGVHRAYVGDLVRCTRHACGRLWVITAQGVQEPAGATGSPRPAAAKEEPEERDRSLGEIERSMT